LGIFEIVVRSNGFLVRQKRKSSSGDRGLIQSGVEQRIRIHCVIRQKAMTENVGIDRLDVIGMNGVLPLKKCKRSSGRLERQSTTDRDGMVLAGKGPRRLAKSEKVALKVVRDRNLCDLPLEDCEIFDGEHGFGGLPSARGRPTSMKFQDGELALLRRQCHWDRKKEPVQLWFWKGKCSGGGGIILGGHHEEGVGKIFSFSIHRYLPLVHGFKESRLCSR